MNALTLPFQAPNFRGLTSNFKFVSHESGEALVSPYDSMVWLGHLQSKVCPIGIRELEKLENREKHLVIFEAAEVYDTRESNTDTLIRTRQKFVAIGTT